MSLAFHFDESLYSTQPGAAGEFSPSERNEIAALRKNHPELQGWGDFAIASAWGAYSQAVLMMGWSDDPSRAEDFLSFLCWEQTRGKWAWGNSPEGLVEMLPVWRPTKRACTESSE